MTDRPEPKVKRLPKAAPGMSRRRRRMGDRARQRENAFEALQGIVGDILTREMDKLQEQLKRKRKAPSRRPRREQGV